LMLYTMIEVTSTLSVHNGKKITLLSLTPNEIVQCVRAIAETTRRESEIQHASPVKLE
jgi:hypothetical protein